MIHIYIYIHQNNTVRDIHNKDNYIRIYKETKKKQRNTHNTYIYIYIYTYQNNTVLHIYIYIYMKTIHGDTYILKQYREIHMY